MSITRQLSGRQAERGFSLLEAIVVVSMSMVMVALTGKSMMSAVENYRVASASQQVAALVQVARLKAPSHATRYRVRIDATAETYVLERFDTGSSTWQTDTGAAALNLPPDVQFSAAGITAVPPEQPGVTQASEMTFNSIGLLFDTTTLQPADGRCFYLQGKTDRPAAVCSTAVGRTAVYRLHDGTWEQP